MSESIVNQAEVYAAADSLNAEGITPTVTSVRDRIGKGAYSDITRHLFAWKQDPPRRAINQRPPPPESVTQGLSQVWTQAWLLGQEEVAKERQGFEYSRQDIEREKQEMLSEIYRLEMLLESKTMHIEIFDAERAVTREQLNSMRSELSQKLLDIEPSKERWAREKDLLQAELGQLKSEVTSQQAIIEQSYVEQAKLKDKVASLTNEIIQLNSDVTEAQHAFRLANAARVSQQDRQKSLQEELDRRKQSEGHAAEASNQGLKRQLQKLEETLTQEREQLETALTAKRENDELKRQLQKLEETLTQEREQLETALTAKRENDELKRQLQKLEETLTQEREQLETALTAKRDNDEFLANIKEELRATQVIRDETENDNVRLQMALQKITNKSEHHRQDGIEQNAQHSKEVAALKEDATKYMAALNKERLQRKETIDTNEKLKQQYSQMQVMLKNEKESKIKLEQEMRVLRKLQPQTALEEDGVGAVEMQLNKFESAPVKPDISPSTAEETGSKKPYAADQERDVKELSKLFEADDDVLTKLDLAQSYMETGDSEGARNLLGEIMAKGRNSGYPR